MTKEAKELKHIDAVKAFAGAGLMASAALSVALPALAIPAVAMGTGATIEIAGSILAGLGAALWVEKRSA
jgi:hypothetical protein